MFKYRILANLNSHRKIQREARPLCRRLVIIILMLVILYRMTGNQPKADLSLTQRSFIFYRNKYFNYFLKNAVGCQEINAPSKPLVSKIGLKAMCYFMICLLDDTNSCCYFRLGLPGSREKEEWKKWNGKRGKREKRTKSGKRGKSRKVEEAKKVEKIRINRK